MYLKRLEIVGFKSFADKTEMEFAPGITVLAGPNGSGKSNISDAVRFCLGEQSTKTLRALRMEEMIFGGSRSRKALGMAEVTMVFDNADRYFPLDFIEISITRRTFRGGDTQYFINKSPCRWRDIQELFMDTGIGRGALSLVGGREVDMVLSTNPQDRRLILEETAGVNKYFFRKKEAARKLEQTAANLCRLRDIQTEVETSLKGAEAQVTRFNRFRKQQDKLNALETKMLKSDARLLREEKVRRTASIQMTRGELARLAQERAAKSSGLETLRADYENQGLVLEKYRHGQAEVALQLEHLSLEMKSVEERLLGVTGEQGRSRESAAAFARRLGQLDEETETFRLDLETLSSEEENVRQTVRSAEERLAALDGKLGVKEPALLALRRELDGLAQKRMMLRARLESLESQRAKVCERMRRFEEELGTLERTRQSHLQAESLARKSAADAETEFAAASRDHEKLKAARDAQDGALQECTRQLTAARDAFVQYSSKLDALKGIVESYADYYPGVRFLMSRRTEFPGLVGTIADLVTVPREYERALEVSLASHLQDLVVATSDEAKRCLELLKREKAGRVTFWPLDLPRKRRTDRTAAGKVPGVIGWAKELMTFDERLDDVLESLLGKTLVVKDIDTALAFYRRVARENAFIPTLVSLEGDVLSPSGSMTGGVIAHTKKGILTKKRETEELDEQVKQLTVRQEQLTQRRQSCREELDSLRMRLTASEGRLQALEMKKRVADDEVHDLGRRAAEVDRAMQRISLQTADASRELEEADGQEGDARTALQAAVPREQELTGRLAEMSGEIEQEQAERDAMGQLLSDKRVALARVAEKCAALKEKASLYAVRREETVREMEEARRKLDVLAGEIERFGDHRRELDVERSRLTLKAGGFEKLLEEARTQRDALKSGLDRAVRELDELAAACEAAREKVHLVEIEAAQVETQLGDLFSRLEERCESPSQIQWHAVEVLDSEAAQKELGRLRHFLANFGSVNLGALEDFEKLKARHDFLQEQVKDLEDASQSLRDIIAQMDEASTRQFQAAFVEVNARFTEIFTELFNGGSAHLELSDPSNLLDTGVEIVARPPGKKLQNLMLLSSGERALTATSFLMALLKVKPSPFIILDELDAPLDDANVERVADKIKEFSESSQFVIITHNRKTMEYGSALYGVTMEEAGVSRLVSLNLEETTGEKKAAEKKTASGEHELVHL